MYICDCHCDTLSKLLNGDGELYQNSYHLDFKRIIANGGGLQFCAAYVPSEYRYTGGLKYALKLIDMYNRNMDWMRQNSIDVLPILCKKDALMAKQHNMASLLAIEEGGALEGSLEMLRILHTLGVRCITLTWSNRNDIACGINEASTGGGLTLFGRQVVREMNRLGMLIDVSHIAPQGFWHVLEESKQPIIATHSNAKSLCSAERNLDDAQIKAIGSNKGMIGIAFASQFIEDAPKPAYIEGIYRHIDYMLNLIGNDDCIGFGSDFDGIKRPPEDLQNVDAYPRLIEYLQSKNYKQSTIEKIAHGNVLRMLSEVLPD